MFDFYYFAYQLNYLDNEDIREAADWKILTPEEYTEITGGNYIK